MELVTTREKNEIVPYDAEVLNVKLHERSVAQSVNAAGLNQEFIVFGLKKGAKLLSFVKNRKKLDLAKTRYIYLEMRKKC